MSWFANYELKWYHRLCIKVLQQGPVPKHMAIIMDGNRRYANRANVAPSEGHRKGFDKLTEVLQWCRELGVKELTVYAFSTLNFKRSQEEVEMLMALAADKFQHLLADEEKLHEYGVRIRVIGNLQHVPEPVRTLFAKAMQMTQANTAWTINVAFAYTSREEVADALHAIGDGVQDGAIVAEDVTGHLISKCLQSEGSLPLEVLIRTSGEVRFSDFMLWQACNANVIFDDVFWPEFSIWHFFACVFYCQRHYADQQSVAKRLQLDGDGGSESGRIAAFLHRVRQRRLTELQTYAANLV